MHAYTWTVLANSPSDVSTIVNRRLNSRNFLVQLINYNGRELESVRKEHC
jgi:hypothetical protein